MKNLYKNMFKCGFLGAAMLLGTTACSEDHFDVKDQGVGGNTIWKSIEAHAEFSDAKEILQRARVMKDEKDKKANLTFAAWLDDADELVVWLPKNGTFDKDKYIALLDSAEAMKQRGDMTNGLRKEFQVVNQFVKNHVALFNSGATLTQSKVRMLNSKNTAFSLAANEFGGKKFEKISDNSNGILYALEGECPFMYNIYDYMSSDKQFSKVFGIISDPLIDKNVFWPEGSTEGAMNENGEIVYVDSVFTNTNEILNRAGALIKSEDSIYVAFIPNNAAYDQCYDVTKDLFKYGKSYNYDWQDKDFAKKGNNGLKFNVDSLSNASTNAKILESMFFNPSLFQGIDKTDSTELINYVMTADSLISTNGVVFYNKNKGGINPMFEGMTPVKASNGYVFVPAENRIDPTYSFIGRHIQNPFAMVAHLQGCKSERGEVVHLTVENWQKDSVGGEVENDAYTFFEYNGNMTLRFKLPRLASGHYKISAQMLPNRININNVNFDKDGVTQLPEDPRFDVTLKGDDNKNIGKPAKGIHVPQDSVRNVVLFEDIELKKSYASLPQGYETFPILEIKMTARDHMAGGKPKGLSIAKFIIEPVRK